MNNVTRISETKSYSHREQQETTILLHTLIFTLLDKKGGKKRIVSRIMGTK